MNEVIELLKSHKSIRKYKDKSIEEGKIVEIIEAAKGASTSSFIQAYTIIRINDKEKRRAIAALAGNQSYIEECPLFLVFCADLHRLETACEINGREMAKGYTEAFILATVDTALAAENTIIAAEALGLGGVFIGGIRNNPKEVTKLLKLPDNVYPVFGMCLGYPNDNPDVKPRLPMEGVLKIDEYTTEEDEEILEKYDVKVKEYYTDRTSGSRKDTWTGQVSNMMSKPQRPHMREFLNEQGFKMK